MLKYRIWKLIHEDITQAIAVPDAIYDDFVLADKAADILREKDLELNSYIIQVYDVVKGR